MCVCIGTLRGKRCRTSGEVGVGEEEAGRTVVVVGGGGVREGKEEATQALHILLVIT